MYSQVGPVKSFVLLLQLVLPLVSHSSNATKPQMLHPQSYDLWDFVLVPLVLVEYFFITNLTVVKNNNLKIGFYAQ